MHHKNIKAIVRKQLKINYGHWNLLNKKAKKRIARMVLDEVEKDYDFGSEIKTSEPELLGIENQLPTPGIMNLEEMECFINSHKNDVLFKLKKHKKHPTYLKDEELRIIDDILDDDIINKLLSYDGYTLYGEEGHEYKCKAGFGQCPHAATCPGYRSIQIDNGYFQRIPYGDEQILKALEIRKNGERPFNLIKKREGLETVRVRSQHGVIVRSAFTTIVTLLLEMAGTRSKKKKEQTSFLDAVGF